MTSGNSSAFTRLMATTLPAGVAMTGTFSAEDATVAFLNASFADTWLSAPRDEIEKGGTTNDIKVVEFYGQFDEARQSVLPP